MEEDQTSMQPDYKENISHLPCIQDGVFVGLVGTKREKMESKQRKRHVTIVQSVKSSFENNVLKVFRPRVRSENYWPKLGYFKYFWRFFDVCFLSTTLY